MSSISCWEAISALSPSRTTGWSSTLRMRIDLSEFMPGPLEEPIEEGAQSFDASGMIHSSCTCLLSGRLGVGRGPPRFETIWEPSSAPPQIRWFRTYIFLQVSQRHAVGVNLDLQKNRGCPLRF